MAGFPRAVTPEFEDWVNAVRKKVFEGHTSNSTDDAFMQGFLSAWMGQKFWNAIASAEKEYQTYVMARDWWEFDHAQRVPAGFDKPETYGIYLYARFHHLQAQAAAANYKKMTELLGAPRIQAAAKRVMDAPKRGDGGLVVTVEAIKKGPGGGEMIDYDKLVPPDIIGAFADPVRVLEMLATQDDDRRYLLDLLHRHAPDLRTLDPATTWTWADTAYKRLVLAFGEPELLAASHAVRVAPKRLYSGGVMTVNDLGAKRTEPIETVEDLLAVKDPRGYVKAALIFAQDLNSAAAVDAAYKTYMAAKGEQAVTRCRTSARGQQAAVDVQTRARIHRRRDGDGNRNAHAGTAEGVSEVSRVEAICAGRECVLYQSQPGSNFASARRAARRNRRYTVAIPAAVDHSRPGGSVLHRNRLRPATTVDGTSSARHGDGLSRPSRRDAYGARRRERTLRRCNPVTRRSSSTENESRRTGRRSRCPAQTKWRKRAAAR